MWAHQKVKPLNPSLIFPDCHALNRARCAISCESEFRRITIRPFSGHGRHKQLIGADTLGRMQNKRRMVINLF